MQLDLRHSRSDGDAGAGGCRVLPDGAALSAAVPSACAGCPASAGRMAAAPPPAERETPLPALFAAEAAAFGAPPWFGVAKPHRLAGYYCQDSIAVAQRWTKRWQHNGSTERGARRVGGCLQPLLGGRSGRGPGEL